MPYVVPKQQSLQFTGQNGDSIRQVMSGYSYWVYDTGYTGVGIRFNGADGDRMTFAPGDYLVYDFNNARRFSQSEYEDRYRETL